MSVDGNRLGRWVVALLAAFCVLLASGLTTAANPAAPRSLKTIPVPEPENLGLFLWPEPTKLNAAGLPMPTAAARRAAIALGKALFWDAQVGSDGVQACGSCHSHAGADNRTKSQISPGLNGGDLTFQVTGPNGTLTTEMFPFHKLEDPDDRFSVVLSDVNDVAGSQGVRLANFVGLSSIKTELGQRVPDAVFEVCGVDVRRVEPRNAPSVINAVFNFANFWDGRANNIFNGSSPFGDADPEAGVWVQSQGALHKQRVHLPMSSLASQAVGPPGNKFEMSFEGRHFWDLGAKLLAPSLVPLGEQRVHPADSVLGPLSKSVTGLHTTYRAMVQAAFRDKYWGATSTVTLPTQSHEKYFTQMQANFSLFFGLAIQLYEATLVSDDTPFDRFQEGDNTAMSPSARAGLDIFLTEVDQDTLGGSCINCHGGAEFTEASVSHLGATNFGASLPEALLELMTMGDDKSGIYDVGFYDTGVRPIDEDVGRGGTDPFGFPLSWTDRALLLDSGVSLPFDNPLMPCGHAGSLPVCPSVKRAATTGSFKTPTLRNVELTGPYFHNGGQATLRQVIDFYTRGGDFHEQNLATLDSDILENFPMTGNELAKDALVDFLLALTDERVRWEKAPFDHPELLVPHGAPGDSASLLVCVASDPGDSLIQVPAIGAGGRAAEGLPAIGTFLELDPHQP